MSISFNNYNQPRKGKHSLLKRHSLAIKTLTMTGLAFILTSVTGLARADLPCLERLTPLTASLAAGSVSSASQEPTSFLRINSSLQLRVGAKGEIARVIKERLGTEGASLTTEDLEGIAKFQSDLGLSVPGYLDAITALNLLTPSERQHQEWVQSSLKSCQEASALLRTQNPSMYLEVNLASQTLYAYERDPFTGRSREVLRSKVIVGAPHTKTPLKHLNVTGIKFNPAWIPTQNIVRRNVLKNGKFSTQWIRSHGMTAYNSAGKRVPLSAINASNYSSFRYVEPAGDNGSLGALKLETDSPQNIYLHDTPTKKLFEKNTRAASSGCVRTEQIEYLARWLFESRQGPLQSPEQFDEYLAKKKNWILPLKQSVPVYLTYRVIDFDEAGDYLYYPDIYGNSKAEILK